MKTKLTKLEKLFEEPDYGVSTATGSLSKILRGFWQDIGLTHLHINQLIDRWLEDPANEFDQDVTRINDSRGNIRKDNEKDDSSWKVFLRNLRMMRPLELRILMRLKFKDGSTFRQLAMMRPRSTSKHNSDQVLKELRWDFVDDDGLIHHSADDYDDEGIHKDEEGYTPRNICVFKTDEEGIHFCSQEELIDHVSFLTNIVTETIPTTVLLETIIDHVQDTWKDEMAEHLKRLAHADINHDIIVYKDLVADGYHRIMRAYLMGVKELQVKRIDSLPLLHFKPKLQKLKSI